MKTCSRCGEVKPLDDFGICRRRKDGRLGQCKPCWNATCREQYHRNLEHSRARKRETQRQNYVANPEAAKAKSRRWALAHPEQVRDGMRRFRAANPDYHREWYQQNIDKERERSREVMRHLRATKPELVKAAHDRYVKANPEKMRSHWRENAHRRRALKGRSSPELATYMDKLLTCPCAYCGSTDNITIDHIRPLSRGGKHQASNLAPACWTCNCSKGAKLLDEWPSPLQDAA